MRGIDLLDSMEMLDLSLIEEADERINHIKKPAYLIKLASIAVVLIFTLGIVFIINKVIRNKNNVVGIASTEVTTGGDFFALDIKDINDSIVSSSPQAVLGEEGLFIPPIEIPNNTDGIMDMLDLVVYRSGIYTQAANYRGASAIEIKDTLVGDYLGYATGLIDEWADEEDLNEEFSSSIEGEVYSVKGYDTDFRICVIWEAEGENGEKELQIEFLERLNGITLNRGSDLFEDRLHLNNRLVSIQYQSHDDWNYAINNIHEADIDDDIWNEFMNSVCNSSFIYTWDKDNYTNTIYDTENQAHIILTMDDNTTVCLRLIEGGYVGYDSLGWYFVQIPVDVFNSIFEACR